ncbi:MAG TPA: hypothetical protein VNB51_10010 [Candidatus Udaeobacter sp.]|nr:hypothetical protein [Candidatus Udaeobacter sp.]
MRRSVVLLAAALLTCTAPAAAPTPTVPPSGPPRVSSVVSVGDTITVTFSRPMLQMGEASGVEMRGNYQLDGRALASATRLACQTPECIVVAIDLPAGTLVPQTSHTLRIANLVALSGPSLVPDPTTVTFTVSPR